MATTSRTQPPWQSPPTPSPDVKLPPLKLYNSLTRTKNPFIPIDRQGRKVTWYCCGPTVYDAGHLGHARNYVSTDILRRILRDYFGYDVEFVMNITDVDDKIIKQARRQHFLTEFVAAHNDLSDPELQKTTLAAFSCFIADTLPLVTSSVTPESYTTDVQTAYQSVLAGGTITGTGTPGDAEALVKRHLRESETAAAALVSVRTNPSSISREDFFKATGDVLAPYLDSQLKSSIGSDSYEIFTKLTQYWERHFNEDLRTLNCLPPTFVTRVTEFIRENVKFIEKIIKNGFAYPTSDGSVFFDIGAFEAAGNSYARLEPWNKGNDDLRAEGEGSLSKKKFSEKKSSADFALWKHSKEGEPSWPSPWGPGRPGWHIECSVMASEVLGSQIDIHSGGIDLAFPHHDNEIAQSEAYWSKEHAGDPTHHKQHQWINYFLHMGHLSISGSKMSKSLKNFVSIREALSKGGGWTARGLRVIFLLGGWRDGIEVTPDVVAQGTAWEQSVNKFFTTVKARVSEESEEMKSGKQVPQLFRKEEHELYDSFSKARAALHDALCDSFNTPLAMSIIADTISKSNIYITANQKSYLSLSLLKEVARWITHIVSVFGLDASTSAPDGGDNIGWSAVSLPEDSTTSGGTTNTVASAQEFALPYIRVLSLFRDRIRQLAISQPSLPISKELLTLSDTVRDHDLANLGVSLDDRDSADGKPALVKFVPREELIAAREEKLAKVAERERKKEEARLERERLEKEKAEKGKLSPYEMFKTAEYSAWDADGLPTKDAQGEEITKSKNKKLKKDWDRQKKAHEAWKGSAGAAPS